MKRLHHGSKLLLSMLAMLTAPGLLAAADYPDRPVRVIVTYAPGGVTDVVSRLVAQKLGERLGKQFFVDNVNGGAGNVGMGQAAHSAADGYTLLFAFSSFGVNPTLFEKVPYDPVKDFDPVTLLVTSTTVLGVHPSVPAQNLDQLVALIKANPAKYSYASAGAGTQSHLAGEQFRLSFGLDLVHVPFPGGGPALVSIVGGHTPIGFIVPAPAVPSIKDGKMRAIAVTSKQRTRILPDVPTMTEAGHGEIEGDTWVGILAPKGTPRAIIDLLRRETSQIIADPEMTKRLVALGCDPIGGTPEEFAARIKTELATWAKVIHAANIKPQ